MNATLSETTRKGEQSTVLLATGEDYRYPATTGHGATLMTKFMHRYMNHVIALATESVAVRSVLLRAFSLMIPPTALFHPRISFRVLVHILKPRLRASSVLLWWPLRPELTTETQRTQS